MVGSRRSETKLVLGTLTAAVALLAGLSGASAQSAPGAGSFPGSFLVPGTNTSLKVGGYVKLDVTYDINSVQANIGGVSSAGVNLNGSVLHAQTHGFQLNASESRFNFETRTPSAYGEVKTFIEGDFIQASGQTNGGTLRVGTNSYGARLRLAYGTIGPWMFGQNVGVQADGVVSPESLDFQGQLGGGGPTRLPQVRYTYLLPAGQSIAVGIEEPESTIVASTGNVTLLNQVPGSNGASHMPWTVGNYVIDQPWGHFHFGAGVTTITMQNGTLNSKHTVMGWDTVAGARINTFGKDSALVGAAYNQGGSRETGNSPGEDAEINFTTGQTRALAEWSGFVGYLHYWTDTLRSSATMSYEHMSASNDLGAAVAATVNGQNKWAVWHTANIIWSPVPQVNTGFELIYIARKTDNPNANLNYGEDYRIQFSTQVKF